MIYFIAAGKGSRMNSELPKALHKVDGIPNIVRNINMINDDYRVVINVSDIDIFSQYIDADKIYHINSGLGSGHAIMQLHLEDDDIIIWGDAVILNTDIIEEIKKTEGCSIPLKHTDNPYVNFLCDKRLNIKEVLFSKYGEKSSHGLQDVCIFKVTKDIIEHLNAVHNATWKGRYITESNEFEFHYIMHYKYNIHKPAKGYITQYPNSIESYNTKSELKQIENKIRKNK